MSSTAHSPDLDALPLAPEHARKPRGVFVSFAIFVVVGFGLAGWYVSRRIMTAEAQSAGAVQPMVLQAEPAAHVALSIDSVPKPVAAPDAVLPLALEYYLQVAALGTSEDEKYLKRLGEMGYSARIDATAADHEARILIGPYSEESLLRSAREKLMADGVLAIEYIR